MKLFTCLLSGLCISACAGLPAYPDPTADMRNPTVRSRVVGGDQLTEYRQHDRPVRIVTIVPDSGPAFYLIDDDGDGRVDRSLGEVAPRYLPALAHPMPFEDYGLVELPLRPRRGCDRPRQPMRSLICPD